MRNRKYKFTELPEEVRSFLPAKLCLTLISRVISEGCDSVYVDSEIVDPIIKNLDSYRSNRLINQRYSELIRDAESFYRLGWTESAVRTFEELINNPLYADRIRQYQLKKLCVLYRRQNDINNELIIIDKAINYLSDYKGKDWFIKRKTVIENRMQRLSVSI